MIEAAWDASLETGNELIDSQHRELNAFVNELRAAGIKSDAEYLEVLDKVMDFALFHFDAEEKLMAQVGYPPYLKQEMVEEHKEFKSVARKCVLEFRQGDMSSVVPLQSFIEKFLKSHESGTDKKLADWIRDNYEATDSFEDTCEGSKRRPGFDGSLCGASIQLTTPEWLDGFRALAADQDLDRQLPG